MDGFSPHLPFVVAREGFELDLQAVLLHCLHSLGGQCASRVIGTDGDVEQVESLVELGALRQDARHDGLKVHASFGLGYASENTGTEYAQRGELVQIHKPGVESLASTHRKTGKGPVTRVGIYTEIALYERDDAADDFPAERCHSA